LELFAHSLGALINPYFGFLKFFPVLAGNWGFLKNFLFLKKGLLGKDSGGAEIKEQPLSNNFFKPLS